jgi:hypothetical protein
MLATKVVGNYGRIVVDNGELPELPDDLEEKAVHPVV